MARIDYFGVLQSIKTKLANDADLTGASIVIEEPWDFNTWPHIGIYLDSRNAPSDRQYIGGVNTGYLLRILIICSVFSLDSISKAIQNRDDLLGKVEVVLMKDRTFANSGIATSWIEGGSMPSGQVEGQSGCYSQAEIVLVVDARITT